MDLLDVVSALLERFSSHPLIDVETYVSKKKLAYGVYEDIWETQFPHHFRQICWMYSVVRLLLSIITPITGAFLIMFLHMFHG
jgi:hypothetical protein